MWVDALYNDTFTNMWSNLHVMLKCGTRGYPYLCPKDSDILMSNSSFVRRDSNSDNQEYWDMIYMYHECAEFGA